MAHSPLRLPAFKSGNGSLIPFDYSDTFVRLAILSIRSLPVVCWLYLAAYLFVPSSTVAATLPLALRTKWLKLLARYVWFPWSIIEVAFSLYHAYLVRKVQGPGPRPIYSRRFLRKVFARALKSGLGLDNLVKADETHRQKVEQDNIKDATESKLEGTGTDNKEKDQSGAAQIDNGSNGDDPEPWFKANALTPDDPRARKFQREQAKWFHLDPQYKQESHKHITRRDVSHWLAWSLFTSHLEDIEAEHSDISKKARAGDELPQIASDGQDTAAANDADEEDPNLRKVYAEPGEWSNPEGGTRLDFLRKARRMLEARQGQRYPLKRDGEPGPEEELDGEGGSKDQPLTGSMRLTIDPVVVEARPFLVYCITQSLSRFTLYRATRHKGFELRTSGRLSYLISIPSSWSPEKAADPGSKGKYRPTIFLHGLGIGLAQYHALIDELAGSALSKTHPIMIPIQPHISQNLFSPHFLEPIGHHEMVTCLRKAMKTHRFDGDVQVLSHSMGTIVHAWLLKSLGSRIARSCFVDPIPFRLFIPDVCGNFLYFNPDNSIKRLLRFFVGREIGTANTLSRHFDWSSNILWPEDEIPNLTSPHHTRFFLAGQDVILNCQETRDYLLEYGVREEVSSAEGKRERGGMVVDWKAAHGELLMKDGVGMKMIMQWLQDEDEDE